MSVVTWLLSVSVDGCRWIQQEEEEEEEGAGCAAQWGKSLCGCVSA